MLSNIVCECERFFIKIPWHFIKTTKWFFCVTRSLCCCFCKVEEIGILRSTFDSHVKLCAEIYLSGLEQCKKERVKLLTRCHRMWNVCVCVLVPHPINLLIPFICLFVFFLRLMRTLQPKAEEIKQQTLPSDGIMKTVHGKRFLFSAVCAKLYSITLTNSIEWWMCHPFFLLSRISFSIWLLFISRIGSIDSHEFDSVHFWAQVGSIFRLLKKCPLTFLNKS